MVTSEPPADPLQLEAQVCFGLAVAARTVIALYRPLLDPLGLTHPQYLVMLALWERSPRSVKEVATALSLDSATLSPCLKRMEAGGLVTRTRSRADERVLTVDLTDVGRALCERARSVPVAVQQRLGMDPDELRDLHAALTRVIAAATRGEQIG